ncbi:MAG: 23S rRNA (adenine(2503)-C(2))-methyltransferase RlmN [Acidimicrobiia bacterium]
MPATPTRYDFDLVGLSELLADEPAYRARQTFDGLHRRLADVEELTDLPKGLRSRLAQRLPAALTVITEQSSADGTTRKWLWSLPDGAGIETVLMHYGEPGAGPVRARTTVCVSTQAGCAMGCGFCATGQAGFERHLTQGEIIEQVVRAARAARDATPSRRVSNVVFMGMGEPLANYDNLWRAVERLHGGLGLSARHLTVSTVGIVPGIDRLAAERLPVNLAVSLHAANDAARDALVPINRRYPLGVLAEACRRYTLAQGRRLSFEWALIDGVNDTRAAADELAAYALPLRAHVNLIPLNPTPGWPTRGTPAAGVRSFRDRLAERGVNATIRHNRGTDIEAACGQLRAAHPVAAPSRRPR